MKHKLGGILKPHPRESERAEYELHRRLGHFVHAMEINGHLYVSAEFMDRVKQIDAAERGPGETCEALMGRPVSVLTTLPFLDNPNRRARQRIKWNRRNAPKIAPTRFDPWTPLRLWESAIPTPFQAGVAQY